MNDVLRKIFIGNQVQHMKDIFVLFKETKREEAILRFFGKVMTKFKKRRVSAAIFRQLKRKLEIKRLITVAEQRQQKREKTFIFQLLKFNIWFQRQKRLALNNLLKNTLRPFSRVASESFAMIKYFVNPD